MRLIRKIQVFILFHNKTNNSAYRFKSTNFKANRTQRVLVSSSNNIYENLALEDWLYENTDFNKESILLLWRNTPCVVFGRHQNPWVECNVPYCQKHDVDLVRRKSGGGTVYHDEGNLNCSFLMDQSLYNRKRNLHLVVDAIKSRWNVPLSVNDRDDIVLLDKYKISGTASKLGGKKTYHHFTLLYNVDKDRLNSILYSNLQGVSSKATVSTRMSVTNLSDHLSNIDFPSLVHVISENCVRNSQKSDVRKVDPCNKALFPGVEKHQAELRSWEWIYGKTPPFNIQRIFHGNTMNTEHVLNVSLGLTKGRIHDVQLNLKQTRGIDSNVLSALCIGLQETPLCPADVNKSLSMVKMEWIAAQLYTVETQEFLDWILQCVMETLAVFPERSSREPFLTQ